MPVLLAVLLQCAHAAPGGIDRVTLIPVAPGGSEGLIPQYSAADLPPFNFELCIDPELAAQDFEDYLEERCYALGMQYSIRIYSFPDGQGGRYADDEKPLLELPYEAAKAGAALDLPAGQAYLWRVQGRVELADGRELRLISEPLFFRLNAGGSHGNFDATTERSISDLRLLSSAQSRSHSALASGLEGRRLFACYPVSSDAFICSALGAPLSLPLPEAAGMRGPALAQLRELGRLMRQALDARRSIREGADPLPPCAELSALAAQAVPQLFMTQGSLTTQAYQNFDSAMKKLDPSRSEISAESAVGALGELAVLLDGMAGWGTLTLNADYQQQFAAYEEEAQQRLIAVSNMRVQLAAVLGPAETELWLSRLEDSRARLALLADEVEDGRLSKRQLAERLALQHNGLLPPADLPNVDRAGLKLAAGAAEQLSALDDTGRMAIARQLLIAHLEALERSLWGTN